jgi:hypothetical protein
MYLICWLPHLCPHCHHRSSFPLLSKALMATPATHFRLGPKAREEAVVVAWVLGRQRVAGGVGVALAVVDWSNGVWVE